MSIRTPSVFLFIQMMFISTEIMSTGELARPGELAGWEN